MLTGDVMQLTAIYRVRFLIGISVVSWQSRNCELWHSQAQRPSICQFRIPVRKLCSCVSVCMRFLIKCLVIKFIMITNRLKSCVKALFHARTNHIDIGHHFIREYVCNEPIYKIYLCTSDIFADLLTKPLSKEHNKFVSKIL